MIQRRNRVPESCPPGFKSRYTVQRGDTMFFIAQTFGVSLDELIEANPHISNPNLIFPGDVLCVPGEEPVNIPCCVILQPTELAPSATGIALVRLIDSNERAVSILALNLPPPNTLGNFDSYEGLIEFPSEGAGGFGLFRVQDPFDRQPPTWAGTGSFPFPAGFTPFPANTRVLVRAANSETGVSARQPVLEATLIRCCR